MRMMLGTVAAVLTAGLAVAADCQKKISFQPTALGAATDTSGTAQVRARGERQRFKVSLDSRVADGTTYVVSVNGMIAGAILIELGTGELEFSNENGKILPAAVNPVCSAGMVMVADSSGSVLLSGVF